MSISKIEKEYCYKILKKMKKNILSNLFLEPVDPIRDTVFDYFDIISRPMDFSTLTNNLDQGIIKNSKEFFENLYLIFDNAIKFHHGKSNFYDTIAETLKKKALKYSLNIPKTEFDLWYFKLSKTSLKIEKEISKLTRISSKKKELNK